MIDSKNKIKRRGGEHRRREEDGRKVERERQGGRGLAEDKKKRGKEKAAGTTARLHPITRLLDVCESLPLSRNKRQDKKK